MELNKQYTLPMDADSLILEALYARLERHCGAADAWEAEKTLWVPEMKQFVYLMNGRLYRIDAERKPERLEITVIKMWEAAEQLIKHVAPDAKGEGMSGMVENMVRLRKLMKKYERE
jgi:hypothetical protein